MLTENDEKKLTLKERLYGFGTGVGLGAPMTFFWNYVPMQIPYVQKIFEFIPPLVGNMLGAAGGSANTQWLAEPTPVALPKNTYANIAVGLSTTLAAGAIVGYGYQAVCDKLNYENPDPALTATVQSVVAGAVTYGLRAATNYSVSTVAPAIYAIGKKSYNRGVTFFAQCLNTDDPEALPINDNDQTPNYSSFTHN